MQRQLLFPILVLSWLIACGGEVPDPCNGAAPGTACVWAGTGERGYNAENPRLHRLLSRVYFPMDLTFDSDGRGYIVDWNNHRIRGVESDDSLVDVVGTDYEGDGPPEMQDRLPVCDPEGALGTTVALNHPTEARFGSDGLLYISAWHNNKIRVLDPKTGMVTALVGNGYGYSGDGGLACRALMNQPKSMVMAPDGTIYTIDQRNVRIRKITPDQTISTIAGIGTVGDIGDGGPASSAQFGFEIGTTPRPSGSLALAGDMLYIADSLNNRIRRIDLDTGMIDCIAGLSGAPGYTGDGGLAINATFNFPMDLELGPDGRLYIADRYNSAVRAIDLTTGIIETVAGGTHCSNEDSVCPDVGPVDSIGLNEPYGIAFDRRANLYIADTHNHRILKVIR